MSAPFSPSFSLPPCPACSNIVYLSRPAWRLARNASLARGRQCYFWTGCDHAAEVGNPRKLRTEDEEMQLIEEAWADRAATLFDQVTAKWTDPEKVRFRRAIEERKSNLPGATDPLPLTQAPPAQQNNERKEENHA